MMKHEFTERTGYTPTDEEYDLIEQSYYDFDGQKDDFCKAWKQRQKNGSWEIEANLRRKLRAAQAQVDGLEAQLQEANDMLGKAGEDRDYFHDIANREATENDKLRKEIEALEAQTPEITICSKSGTPEKYKVQAVCYHDNGISFINVVEPTGWITSHRIADINWFEIRKEEKEA